MWASEPSLATYGDYAFAGALTTYLLALGLHAAEPAVGHAARRKTRSAARESSVDNGEAALARRPEAVLAGPPPSPEPVGATVTLPPGTPRATPQFDLPGAREEKWGSDQGGELPARPASTRSGRAAVSVTVLGLGVQALSLLLRGLAAGRAPWGNMYEFSDAITFVAVTAWLLLLTRHPDVRRIGVFVLLPVTVLMFLAGTVLYAPAGPLVPALQSYWLAIHVLAAAVASGVLIVAGVASLLSLFATPAGRADRTGTDRAGAPDGAEQAGAEQAGGERAGGGRGSATVEERRAEDVVATTAPAQPAARAALLPSRATLDRIAYRATAVGFPIWTFAVIAGAVWAEAAWGRYWGWDPKETTAFIAWVVYAAYLHARATAGWRGARAALVNVAGLTVMLFNLFVVNLVITGLHSYAGVR